MAGARCLVHVFAHLPGKSVNDIPGGLPKGEVHESNQTNSSDYAQDQQGHAYQGAVKRTLPITLTIDTLLSQLKYSNCCHLLVATELLIFICTTI